jgi:protein-S-isoprenylcysteine O-methyltransferase Ste14
MMQRFASASAVASVAIALAAGGLRLNPVPSLESRYLLVSIWCVVPLAWGLWAMLTPKSWLPQRLPRWGAILGLIAGLLVVFVLDLPAQFRGEPLPAWLRGVGVLLAIGIYYLLWLLVRRAYRALAAPSPTA